MVGTRTHFNPFPGLRPFEAEEDYLFFGREGQTDELLRRLSRHRFLAVVGTSGSGKSSLVRAGLLPSLYSGYMTKASSSWRVALLRPDSDPIGNLARALNHPDVLGSKPEDGIIRSIIFTETTLRRSALGLVEFVQQAKMPLDENLLIVVDQFEELFRFKQSNPRNNAADEAAAFVKLLLEATRQEQVSIYVLLTMRSEYLGESAQFRDLPEAINDSQYLIPRLTRDQRRAAIAGPVAVGGAKITPRLVNRLLNDVGDDPDQLPILQHALMRTWDNHKDGEPIDLHHYEAIGGMTNALSKHGDEIYNKLSARHKEIAKKLFKCLTDKGPYGRGIRRPSSLKEVCDIACSEEEDAIAVVEQFRGPSRSFLMPPDDEKLDAKTVLDISHESLMRVWQQLKAWVDEEVRSARIYRRLAETSGLYQEGKARLFDEPELTIALNWREQNKPNEAWAQRYAPNFEQAMNFLEQSRAAREAKIAEQERVRHQEEEFRRQQHEIELQKRARRNITYALIVASTCLFVAIGLGLVALFQYTKAEKSNIKALSATSEVLSASNQEFDALIEGLKAGRQLQWTGWETDADTKKQVVSALQQAVYWVRERNRLERHQAPVYQVSFSPDGQILASASADYTVKLWKRDGTLLNTLTGHRAPVYQVSFSPDGQILASASADYTVKLWKRDGTLLNTLTGHRAPVYRVSFSPDGQILASASADYTVKIWKRDGTLLNTLTGHRAPVYRVSFSPDGQILASASADHTVKIWKRDGTLLNTLTGHSAPVYQVSFSPDGQILASASADHTVKIWKRDGTLIKTLTGHGDWVWDVMFSRNGQMLASASRDHTVKLWKSDGTFLNTLTGHRNDVYRVSFSPDGQMVASASADKNVKLWGLDGTLLTTLTGHNDEVIGMSFSPDGQTLASASYDKTIKLWRLRSTLLTILQGHKDGVSGVSFSPDGQTVATASYDNTVKLWKRDGTLLNTLIGHSAPVSSVSFSPDGQQLASGSYDNTVKLWKRDGTLVKTLTGHSAPVLSVSFSPDGQTLASASYDHTVKLWKSDGTLLKTLTGHSNKVLAVSFSPDGQTLASASMDKTVKIWKTNGSLLPTLKGHDGLVTSVSFSPDGRTLASASMDKTVKIWKTDGTLVITLKGHRDGVLAVSFSPNGQTLASTSRDKRVILWNLPSNLDNQPLNYLLARGCDWVHDYLKTNPNVAQEDRQLCEGK